MSAPGRSRTPRLLPAVIGGLVAVGLAVTSAVPLPPGAVPRVVGSGARPDGRGAEHAGTVRGVHVLVAPDSFSGTLTAHEAAEAIARGWWDTAPDDVLTVMPLSDGGPGFVDVIGDIVGVTPDAVTVTDLLGREVPATLVVVDDDRGRTVYVESAQAAGLHLLPPDRRNPCHTTTFGVGQLITAALDTGATRLVVGVGGSGTNDAGAGMFAALGAGDRALLGAGGLALDGLPADALAGLGDVRARLAGVELVAATTHDAPLLALKGTSAVHAEGKGASPAEAQQLEHALSFFADVVGRSVPVPMDPATGRPRRIDREPGAGCGGGLGYALLVLGARRVVGIDLVLELAEFATLTDEHDVVVTGEGCFDWASLRDTVVAGVSGASQSTGTPCIVIAGHSTIGRRESMGLGLSGSYVIATGPKEVPAVMADPARLLRERTARVATTWSAQF